MIDQDQKNWIKIQQNGSLWEELVQDFGSRLDQDLNWVLILPQQTNVAPGLWC
jgi:hypothetical protein